MRLSFKELDKIKKKYGVDTLWSFSRFDSYRTSHYEYFLKYILKAKPLSKTDSAYAPIGGAVHDILENFYTGKTAYQEMIKEFEDVWTVNVDTLGFTFNKDDNDKDKSIGDKYYKDLQHFFTHYNSIGSSVACETFVPIKITDDIVFQGYIDAVYKDADGFYNIVDYKTSTMYSGKAIDDHAAQLVLYSEGLHQMGVPKDKIKCCWNFLKYVSVDYQQVNGKIATSHIERCLLGEKMVSKAKVWLKKLGYLNQSDELLTEMVATNSLDCLPDDVREKFTVRDCYIYVDDIFEKFEELKEEIINTIMLINNKTGEYQFSHDDHVFWDDEETCKKQSYYFSNLSDYSIDQLKPYKEYIDKLEREKNDPLGMGFGSANNFGSSVGAVEADDDDLSWLKDLV